jgi:hypothetical protein
MSGRLIVIVPLAVMLGLAIAGVTAPPARVVSANLANAADNDNQDDTPFLGSYITTVHAPQSPVGPRTFKALDTFTPGGGILVTFFAPDGTQNSTHGTWSRTGDREVTITHVGIAPDAILPSGERVSFVSVKVREKFTFDGSGNNYTGVWHAEFFDASGNTVRTGSGTMEGARIVVNPLDID